MKLYGVLASDTGNGKKTRGGHKVLQATFTADTKGGRSKVVVRLETQPDGSVVMTTDATNIKEGFTVANPQRRAIVRER